MLIQMGIQFVRDRENEADLDSDADKGSIKESSPRNSSKNSPRNSPSGILRKKPQLPTVLQG